MMHVELFGKLREYKIYLTIMDEEEAIDKKSKGLALKTSIPSIDDSEDDNAEGSDAKNLNFLVRRFNKFLKKKKKNFGDRTFQPKKNFKKSEPSSSSYFTCFECGKTIHVKVDCHIYQKKQHKGEKKKKCSFKKKKAYIAWDMKRK